MAKVPRPRLIRCSCTLAAALLCLFALTITQAGGAQQCNGEESRCFHGDRLNKRSAAVSIDPTNCLVQGSGVGPNIIVSNKNLITVTAKDSSGNNLGFGGANIYVSITNKCSRGSNMSCIEAPGTVNIVGSQIIGKMTDNSDGTYSYSYSIACPGYITVAVILVMHVDVAAVFYDSTNLSGAPYNSNSSSNLNYDWGLGSVTDLSDNVSARFTGTFIPFTTEIYTLTIGKIMQLHLILLKKNLCKILYQ